MPFESCFCLFPCMSSCILIMHTLSCHHSHIRTEGKENSAGMKQAYLLRNVPEKSTNKRAETYLLLIFIAYLLKHCRFIFHFAF